MKCHQCNSENKEEARFCEVCGARLEIYCLSCGFPCFPTSKFCNNCGNKLEVSLERADVIPTASERRHVTVLFSDISGYTMLFEQLDPEEVREITTRIFGQVAKVVATYEGCIEKFIGDAVLAIFGVPIAHEDDPIRAIWAALELHEIVNTISREVEDKIRQRISLHTGINTGLIVTGQVKVEKGTHGVAGDTLNLASRLSALAGKDEILVGPRTYRLAKDRFAFECLGLREIKGKKEPLTVYKLHGGDRGPGRTCRLLMGSIGSPVVGRDEELSVFDDCLETLRANSGRILCIMGEAGLGKSRLVAEVRARAAVRKLLWLEGRCLSFGQMISYWPFIEIIKALAGITEEDDDAAAWTKLKNRVTDVFSNQVAESLPYLAGLLALEVEGDLEQQVKYLDGEAIRRQIFRTLRELFLRLSQECPLVLVFEDLQWADQTSLEMLEHLWPLVRQTPVLICCVSRPHSGTPAAQLLETAAQKYPEYHKAIVLSALSSRDSLQLVRNVMRSDGLPTRTIDMIMRKAEGNPFFIEEIIRSLVDIGALVRDGVTGQCRASAWIEEIDIPDTLRGVIMARIDRLNEELKNVLKTAAVMGRIFLYRVIRAVADAEKELDQRLIDLQTLELIRVKTFLPDLEYIFKHALTQEVTYESILLQRRRELHLLVGDCIEALFKDRLEEFFGMLAYHYTRAEHWEKAQYYLFKAGDQAGRIAADAEALVYYKKAIAAHERVFGDRWDPLQRAVLEGKMGEALYRRGDHREAMEYFGRALDLLGSPVPSSRWGIRLSILKHLFIQVLHWFLPGVFVREMVDKADSKTETISHIYEGMAWIDPFWNRERLMLVALRGLNYAERKGFCSGIARASMAMGSIFDFFGIFSLAEKYHRRAAVLGEKLQSPVDTGHCYFGLAFHEDFLGHWEAATSYYRIAADLFWKAGDVRKWGDAVCLTAFLHNHRGEFAQSLGLFQKIAEIGEKCGDLQLTGWGLHGRGLNLMYTGGDLDEAIVYLERAVELLEAVPDYYACGISRKDLGRCYLRQGRIENALEVLEETNKNFSELGLKGHFVSFARNALAAAHLAVAEQTGGLKNASTWRKCRRACKAAVKESKGYAWALPEAYRLQGTYYWLEGNTSAAAKWWDGSLESARGLGAIYELGITYLEMGKRMRDSSHLKEAETIFKEIGATLDLSQTLELMKLGNQVE